MIAVVLHYMSGRQKPVDAPSCLQAIKYQLHITVIILNTHLLKKHKTLEFPIKNEFEFQGDSRTFCQTDTMLVTLIISYFLESREPHLSMLSASVDTSRFQP